jgi:hypothetical protein
MNLQLDFRNNFAALVGGEIEKLVAKFPKSWQKTMHTCVFWKLGAPKSNGESSVFVSK